MHTDDGTHDTAKTVCGWVKAFHSSGLLVTLPVPVHGEHYDYASAFANVSAALAAGFTAALPGMEPGEEKEEIGWVLKRTKTNNDKSESPIIDLYSTHDKVTFKVFSKYLDSAEEIAAFEAASGLRVSALQNFPGTAAPQRGANKQSDAFILKVPKPFSVVMEPNPKFNDADADAARAANKAYPVPKKRFVRWDKPAGAQAPEPREPDARPQADPQTPSELATEYRFCVDDGGFERLEAIRERLWAKAGADEKLIMKGASNDCRQRLADSVAADDGKRKTAGAR